MHKRQRCPNERMNERPTKRTNEWMNEWLNKRIYCRQMWLSYGSSTDCWLSADNCHAWCENVVRDDLELVHINAKCELLKCLCVCVRVCLERHKMLATNMPDSCTTSADDLATDFSHVCPIVSNHKHLFKTHLHTPSRKYDPHTLIRDGLRRRRRWWWYVIVPVVIFALTFDTFKCSLLTVWPVLLDGWFVRLSVCVNGWVAMGDRWYEWHSCILLALIIDGWQCRLLDDASIRFEWWLFCCFAYEIKSASGHFSGVCRQYRYTYVHRYTPKIPIHLQSDMPYLPLYLFHWRNTLAKT